MTERPAPYDDKDSLIGEQRKLIDRWKAGDRSDELVSRFRVISLDLISQVHSKELIDSMCEILVFDTGRAQEQQ